MAKQKTELELTWVGKDQRRRIEPRISEDDIFDNILIYGNNLLALKPRRFSNGAARASGLT